jgi:hypothetical protein
MWRSWNLLQSRVLISRAHERLGAREQAANEIAQLLRDWRRADGNLSLLAEARALCDRVSCAERGSR